jgi:hypothetical protein
MRAKWGKERMYRLKLKRERFEHDTNGLKDPNYQILKAQVCSGLSTPLSITSKID